ncbi:MAG: diacylglycerol/lipid kinase family protein [Thermoanaerobaculales bacterium]
MILIVNPAAAGGRLGRQWPRLCARLNKVGKFPNQVLTEAPGHATELAAAAVRGGERVVVAAGGDGTICEVVQGLHDAGGGTLGVLPLGTGNDAARTLGLPLDLERAAGVLLGGATRRVDLMRAGDRVVLNAIGIGLLGAINVNSTRIKVVRGIAGYLAATVGTLFSYHAPEVGVSDGTFRYQGGMTILAIHNGPTTGGGFRLAPGAVADDGVLDACLVGPVSIGGRIVRLGAALKGTLGKTAGAHELRFHRLELTTEVALPCHLDGNPCHIEPPGLVFEVLPAALEVIASRIGG